MRCSNRLTALVCLISCLTLLPTPLPARAAEVVVESLTLPAARHPVAATRFAPAGPGKRPAVILLHGRQGITPFADFYQRRAMAIAQAGMDVYLFTYYDRTDLTRAQNPDPAIRRALYHERIVAWAALVRDAISDILADARCSGAVGLVGFSQGGFLATGVAGTDARVGALVVNYGGIPSVLKDKIKYLPPLLELHGDADTIVAPKDGKELVDLARRLGQPATMTLFPGAGHGFSGAQDLEAQRQTVAFLRERLRKSPD